MKDCMETIQGLKSVFMVAVWFGLPVLALADSEEILVGRDGEHAVLQVLGDEDDDWVIESTDDVADWSESETVGTLLSGTRVQAPVMSVPLSDDPEAIRLFRARKTDGLFDPNLLRVFYLTFEAENWEQLLTQGRDDGSNTPGVLELDNGARIEGIGARYRGNSSFNLGGDKKSINLEIDFTDLDADLMGVDTLNLNNAAADSAIMREPIYFSLMSEYTVSPRGAQAQVFINNENWGVYSLAQQQDGDLIRDWFPSNDGDRWRAPNRGGATDAAAPGGGGGGGVRPPRGGPGGGGGGGGGGGFTSDLSALSYQGESIEDYLPYYELDKSPDETVAWERLVHAIDVLHNTPADEFRDRVEDVFAVDRWLWFLGIEIVFADDDSYWHKGADYMFYYEPESGRIHPIQHDGNESFAIADVGLSPVEGVDGTNRPMLYQLLSVPELRQRYLAHMRTFLTETFNPDVMTPLIDAYHARSRAAIEADPKKNFSNAAHLRAVTDLKSFVTNRYDFLITHPELASLPPEIVGVQHATEPRAGEPTALTVEVQALAGEGIDSVWAYHRDASFGRFERVALFDDGAHGDGVSGDGIYGGHLPAYLAGTRVRYYVEARSGNEARAATFAPARAEEHTFDFRVLPSISSEAPPLVLNELMASNDSTITDPQGDFDDWIEIWNGSDEAVDLSGMYLSDKTNDPRKWPFPDGTVLGAGEYLIVWADENGGAEEGLHANFKLSSDGESVFLVDTDERSNALVDSIAFPSLGPDVAFGRVGPDGEVWDQVPATPGEVNP